MSNVKEIKFVNVEHLGQVRKDGEWDCNKWDVKLEYNGREINIEFYTGMAIPEPTVNDVVYSLLMDAQAVEFDSFESWAKEYGYNIDSRKDESIYKECLENASKIKYLLGDDLDHFKESYKDY